MKLPRRATVPVGRLTYLVAALAVTAVQSAAQNSTGGSPPKAESTPKPVQASSSVQPHHILSQFVLSSNGEPVGGATVVLTPVGGKPGTRGWGATTDAAGHFRIDSLPAGAYELRVAREGMTAPKPRQVVVDGMSVGDIFFPSPKEPSASWTLVILVLYLGTIMMVRWHSIARSLDEMIKGQLSALSARLDLEVESGDTRCDVVATLKDTVAKIDKDFRPKSKDGSAQLKFSFADFLFWSRGRENAAWVAIHEVERQLAAYLTPPERVVSYLQMANIQLRAVNTPQAIALAEAIRVWLPSKPDEASTDTQKQHRRALLSRAIAFANEERDRQFSGLMEWHNKASWLIMVAVIIIAGMTLAAGHAVIFLAGAAGGFLSRLTRALRREDLPLDYGASWTTLFLSPLFGALIAWFGVALITLATQENVSLLGNAFRLVDWNTPTAPTTLAVAFLLGFSERFFDAVLGAVERRAERTRAADEAAKATSAAASSIPMRPAAGDTAGAAHSNGASPEGKSRADLRDSRKGAKKPSPPGEKLESETRNSDSSRENGQSSNETLESAAKS